nr:WD40 repeat domain-containing protein [Pseudocalidococcus azoricus]
MNQAVNKKFWTKFALGFAFGLGMVGGLPAFAPLPATSTPLLLSRRNPQAKLEVIKQFQGHQLTGEAIIQIHYSRDGRYLLSTATDGLAKIWSANGDLVRELAGQPIAMLFNGQFNQDATQIVTASYDGTVRIWNFSGQALKELRGHTSGATDVRFLGPGVVSSSDDGSIKFWSMDGTAWSTLTRPGVSRNMDLSPNRDLIAVTQDIGTITLLNPKAEVVKTIQTGQGRLNSVNFSADGQRLVTAGFDGTARVFNLDGRELLKLKVLEKGWVTGAAFSRDNLIATVSDDGVLRLWDVQGTLLDSYNPNLERLGSVAFHPNGQDLAVAAYHGTIILLKLNN